MIQNNQINVLFVGETWATDITHIKGFDVVHLGGYEDCSVWLKNALRRYPDVNLVHMPNHVALGEFPKTLDELKKFDVLILSDIGKNTLILYPEMFKVPMGPNRLDIIKKFVETGGALVMGGGYLSFQGFRGIANYHKTPIEDVLPVFINDHDDRVETPDGAIPAIVEPNHPIVKGIPEKWPMFLGYNKLKIKDGATLIAKYNEDPFIAVWSHENGRAMVFASDLAPHWGTAFAKWEYYPTFWYQSIRWLAGKS